MLHRKSVLTSALLISALVLVGCAKPPQQAIQAAEAALDQVTTAQGATYAVPETEAANAAMDAARQEIQTQDGKFALTRSYKKASELLADAQAKAEAAAAAAVTGKQVAEDAANTALTAAQESYQQTQSLLADLEACPRKPKGFAADLEALKGRSEAFASTLATIGETIAQQNYFQARGDAEAVGEEITALVTDLEGAKAKLKC